MRKIATLLLSLLLLCSMHMKVFAGETTITATVPDSHSITVTADGADVFCNGQSGNQFTVDRLSEPVLLIRALSGKEITQLLLNGEDITGQIKGGHYTLKPIYENKTLTVVTKDETAAQGNTYTIQGTFKWNGQPVAGITIELRSTLKTGVTDSSGNIHFSNVECGKHSLTAIENGKIVGYVEFMLTEGNESNLSLSDGIYTVTANPNEMGIDLMLELAEDDAMRIAGVTGMQSDGNPGSEDPDRGDLDSETTGNRISPKTGDNMNLLFCLVIMLIAFAGFIATFVCHRKRNVRCT